MYINDLPIENKDDDKLNFHVYCDTIFELIEKPETKTPLTIGIFGSWGAGKTSLMRMIYKISSDALESKEQKYQTVWFDAWKYDKEIPLWRALLLQVLATIRSKVEHKLQKAKTKKGLST